MDPKKSSSKRPSTPSNMASLLSPQNIHVKSSNSLKFYDKDSKKIQEHEKSTRPRSDMKQEPNPG